MSRHIFYVANTQADNLGDLVINVLLLKELSKLGKLNVNVKNCSDNYCKMLSSVNFKKTDKPYIYYVFDMLFLSLKGNKVDFYLKPGHFYGDDGGIIKKSITLICYMLMKLSGIKISRLGSSLGPYNTAARKIESLQSYFFKTYTARENISIEYAKKIGIKNTKYCPDMAFLLGRDKKCESNERPLVVFSFREKTLADDDNVLDLKSTLMQIISYFKNKKFVAVSQVTSDYSYNQSLLELSGSNRHIVFDNSDDGRQVFDTYSDTCYVLSNRLHVLLFAASKGAIPVPVIEQDKHIKITGIFNAAILPDLIYDLNGNVSINEHLSYIEKNMANIVNRLDIAFDEQANQILTFLQGQK
jgi:polysaccharide pyruvyl transferase WcaK-like protein